MDFKPRRYDPPMYGPHGTSDVLAFLDNEAMGKEGMRFKFRANPLVMGMSNAEFQRVLEWWCRERHQHVASATVGHRGYVMVYLAIPRKAVTIAA